jgi:NADH-quinone oxidoreductase subunit L
MFRLVFVVFYSPARTDAASHAHESSAVMTLPLIVLVIPTIIAGFWGIDAYINATGSAAHGTESTGYLSALLAPFIHAPLGALFGLGAVLLGFCAAWGIYYGASKDPLPLYLGGVSRAMRNRFYFDEFYAWLINLTHENLARLAAIVDRWIVGGLIVRGVQGTTELFGRGLRLAQTGNLQTYAFLFVVGLAALLYFFFRH